MVSKRCQDVVNCHDRVHLCCQQANTETCKDTRTSFTGTGDLTTTIRHEQPIIFP